MSFKQYFTAMLVYLFALVSYSPYLAQDPKAILMVVSSYGEDNGETKPGYEFDEFAKAYIIFKENGFNVTVASPNGGAVEADEYDPEKPYNQLVLQDKGIMAKLGNTLATSAINSEDYVAIFVVGGKGAMFDLPNDRYLQSIISELYENKAVVSAVCHGPAALVNVKLSNGDYLVSGKRVNGFTNLEEEAFSKKWKTHFDFLLEDKLVERGALFESSALMLNHVAVDGHLITGQNPFSTTNVALEVVKALGISPVPHTVFKEDATIELVADIMAGDTNALNKIRSANAQYQIELAGMYGYYLYNYAQNDTETQHAINIMDAANVTMNHPVLKMTIIQAHQKLGQMEIARTKAQRLAKEMPENDKVKELLASLEVSAD